MSLAWEVKSIQRHRPDVPLDQFDLLNSIVDSYSVRSVSVDLFFSCSVCVVLVSNSSSIASNFLYSFKFDSCDLTHESSEENSTSNLERERKRKSESRREIKIVWDKGTHMRIYTYQFESSMHDCKGDGSRNDLHVSPIVAKCWNDFTDLYDQLQYPYTLRTAPLSSTQLNSTRFDSIRLDTTRHTVSVLFVVTFSVPLDWSLQVIERQLRSVQRRPQTSRKQTERAPVKRICHSSWGRMVMRVVVDSEGVSVSSLLFSVGLNWVESSWLIWSSQILLHSDNIILEQAH